LQLLGLGTAAIVAPEPVRRYWFFGLDARALQQNVPGTIKLSDGTVLHLRDFEESDIYDTIVIPNHATYERQRFMTAERELRNISRKLVAKNRDLIHRLAGRGLR